MSDEETDATEPPVVTPFVKVLLGLLVVGVGVAFAMGAFSSDGGSDGGTDEPDTEELEFAAFDVCTQFVTDRLKAPGTASFRNYFEDDGEVVVTSVGDTYTVVSSVDSENSFGANLRTDFACVVEHTGGESFRLVDLTTDE